MNILFLTLSQAICNINHRGIYPDLLRKFANEGHQIFIICPLERRFKKKTNLSEKDNVHTLGIKTLNITKTNYWEKGIGTVLIEFQYLKAIKKYLKGIHFDLVMYSTPPITFNKTIKYIKKHYNSKSYLLLKDIFPQNAMDLGVFTKNSFLYKFFRKKEKNLYHLSDYIGCMSPANVEFILKHNPWLSKEQVEICPNSIELKNEQYFDKKTIFVKYGIPENVPLFIYGGNLGKPQGMDFLIKILKSNTGRGDVFFIVVGNGTEYHKVESYIQNFKPNNVLLLPGIPRDEFDKLISICDVGLIFLDKRYTIPNYPSRLLSYLENKMPVLMATDIYTDIGPIAEKNGYGFWVESGDLNAFNKKLNYLIENKDIRLIMGEKGHQYLLNNYLVDNSYKVIISHFE